MKRDLSDKEVAALLGKHPRTIQRWCATGKLPRAYKAGRSWRIPRRGLREAKLREALFRGDEIARTLRSATFACEQLREELDAGEDPDPSLRAARLSGGDRNWPSVQREIWNLIGALRDLPELSGRKPGQT